MYSHLDKDINWLNCIVSRCLFICLSVCISVCVHLRFFNTCRQTKICVNVLLLMHLSLSLCVSICLCLRVNLPLCVRTDAFICLCNRVMQTKPRMQTMSVCMCGCVSDVHWCLISGWGGGWEHLANLVSSCSYQSEFEVILLRFNVSSFSSLNQEASKFTYVYDISFLRSLYRHLSRLSIPTLLSYVVTIVLGKFREIKSFLDY